MTQAWSVHMADSVMKRHPVLTDKWKYEAGVVLKGIEQVWQQTGDDKYFRYVKTNVDQFVQPDGSIRTYQVDEYNLDQINPGRVLFALLEETGEEKYRKALALLRQQLATHPRTQEGGFWHKKIYPYQMWLDGIYMAGPFYAQYAQTFDEPDGFDEVARQILFIDRHTCDARTGLRYHGWDESRQQKWANPDTGCSPNFWGRAMGWYSMALVDVLDYMPENHPQCASLLAILESVASALVAVQDASSGLWYQVLDQGKRAGNYLEASASCMFVYALAKGARKNYLDARFAENARRGFAGIIEKFIEIDDMGCVNLKGICGVAGLGGTPYRDGSFEYYIGEPVVTNDYKGIGAFLMASVEMERTP